MAGKHFIKLGGILLALTLFSCAEDENKDSLDITNGLSIEGYVYANETDPCIKLTHIHENGFAEGDPLRAAQVSINQAGVEFPFIEADSLPGWYFQKDSAQYISGNNDFILHISHDGVAHQLPAAMPPKISGLEISTAQISLSPQHLDSTLAILTWEPIEGYQYCIFVRGLDADNFPVNYLEGVPAKHGAFYSLHSFHQVELKCRDFTHYGSYELYVTAVSSDYASFYSNPVNQSLLEDLAGDVPTWGVLAAFNGQSITVQVN